MPRHREAVCTLINRCLRLICADGTSATTHEAMVRGESVHPLARRPLEVQKCDCSISAASKARRPAPSAVSPETSPDRSIAPRLHFTALDHRSRECPGVINDSYESHRIGTHSAQPTAKPTKLHRGPGVWRCNHARHAPPPSANENAPKGRCRLNAREAVDVNRHSDAASPGARLLASFQFPRLRRPH